MSLVFALDLKKETPIALSSENEIVLRGTTRKTLILLHGLTGTPNEMRHLAFYFNKVGYNVVCPHLANHGQPLSILKRTTWEEFYGSVRSVFLKALDSGDQVYVGGLSMSALFVLLLADEFGDRLSGGVCLSPTLFFDGWSVPWYQKLLPFVARTPLKYTLYFREGPPYGIKNPAIQAMVHRSYQKAKLRQLDDVAKFGYAFFPVSLFDQLSRLSKHVIPLLPRIQSPILLIHPKEDDTANLRNSQLIYDRIASQQKKLVVLENSYHVITADQERGRVADEMNAFLGAL